MIISKRCIIEIALRKAGFEVVTANSGSDALNLIKRRGMPHLAIVDLNMPRMSGFEFCKECIVSAICP